MSATNDVNVRRAVSDTVTGAADTLLMSPGRTDGESQKQRGPYRIEDWGKTWMNPNKARVLARVPAIAMPDIAGYWPHTTRPGRRSMPSASSTCSTSFPTSAPSRSSTRRIGTLCSFAGSPRHRPEGPVRSGRRGSIDRSQRLRCGEPYPFRSSDLRGFRKIRGRFPRNLDAVDGARCDYEHGHEQPRLPIIERPEWRAAPPVLQCRQRMSASHVW